MYNNKINQLIELIYEAAINPAKWTELLSALAELVDLAENQSNVNSSDQSYLSIISDNTESSTSISEVLKSITDISLQESENNEADIDEINDLLTRHFARAIKIAKRLVDVDEQHNVVLSLLERMPIALVLVDNKARVIESNTLADELFLSKNGLSLKSNILEAGRKNNQRLFDAISIMSKHDPAITRGQTLSLTNQQTLNNIMLFIAPLRQQNSQQKASVAVFISQRKSLPISLPKEFSELYGLSTKELEVTQQLVRGLRVKDISEENLVSEHTVRSQVKSVLKKTATTRQAELISLVYNGMSSFTTSIPDSQLVNQSVLLNKTILQPRNYKILQLVDGRNLAYCEYGDLTGEPVFHCHSIFGSRLELAFDTDRIAKEKSVHLIVLDRPGYGASDPNPKASLVNWSKDLVELADHLDIEKFSLTGYVMGGMYALACAHEIPERLKRVASISNGMVPESASDYKEFAPFYRMNLRLAKYMPKAYGLITSILIKGALSNTDSFVKQMSENLEQADKEIMEDKSFRAMFVSSLKEAFVQGGTASSQEIIQFMHNWSFKLSDIQIPVDIWHGTGDRHQPLILSTRFTEHVKNTTVNIKQGPGHYMFFSHWSEIIDKLLTKE